MIPITENVGPENAWVGGHGDSRERGPCWFDGLVPLAYLLIDTRSYKDEPILSGIDILQPGSLLGVVLHIDPAA